MYALLRFVSETFRHEAAAYECIQIARTPKDPRAETQILKYFWDFARVNLQQTGPGALILESLQGVGWTRGGNGKVVTPRRLGFVVLGFTAENQAPVEVYIVTGNRFDSCRC